MKTIRVSDTLHSKLTRLLGITMAKTGKTQTYNDVVDALTAQSVFLPVVLLEKIDDAIKANKQSSYATREEFIEAAVVTMLQNLADNHGKSSSKAREKPEDLKNLILG